MGEASESEEMVWVSGYQPDTDKVFHSYKDCSQLRGESRPKPRAEITEEWRECGTCQSGGGSGNVLVRRLERIGRGEVDPEAVE